MPLFFECAAPVVGFRDAEVRRRVGGLLLRREFEEGAWVKEGQVLFRIDPVGYQVARPRGDAQVAQAQAALRWAEGNFCRIDDGERPAGR